MTQQSTEQTDTHMDSTSSRRAAPGKHLIFQLGGEPYGVPIEQVREIIPMSPITALPRCDRAMAGVINLRGRVIAVVDLRRRFELPEADHTRETCIIVLEPGDTTFGVIVDHVCEVRPFEANQLDHTPTLDGTCVDGVTGLARTNDRVVVLLDMSVILHPGEARVAEATSNPKKN